MNYLYPRNKIITIPLYVQEYLNILENNNENINSINFPTPHFDKNNLTTTKYGNFLYTQQNKNSICLLYSSKFYDFYQYHSLKFGYVQIVYSKFQNTFFKQNGLYCL